MARFASQYTHPRNWTVLDLIKAVGLLGLFVLPLSIATNQYWLFWLTVFIEIWTFAVAVMSYDLLIGYSGLLSFGHALYFGGGAYGVALVTTHTEIGFFLAIPISLLAVLVLALVTGAVSVHLTSVYFAMVTLAFAQIAYQWIIGSGDLAGGFDGLNVALPSLPYMDLGAPLTAYYITLVSALLIYWGLKRLANSPFGQVIQAINENEERVQMLGRGTYWYKAASFSIAGLISAYAGILYLLHLSYSDPSLLHWLTTGDMLMMVLIGGTGTLFGAFIGATLYIFSRISLSIFFEQWRLIFGILFIIFVLFFPGGVAGFIRNHREKLNTRLSSLQSEDDKRDNQQDRSERD